MRTIFLFKYYCTFAFEGLLLQKATPSGLFAIFPCRGIRMSSDAVIQLGYDTPMGPSFTRTNSPTQQNMKHTLYALREHLVRPIFRTCLAGTSLIFFRQNASRKILKHLTSYKNYVESTYLLTAVMSKLIKVSFLKL